MEPQDKLSYISKILSDLKLSEIIQQYNYYEDNKFNEFKYKQYIVNLWNEFDEEIKYKNRFTPNSQFIKIFAKLANEANCPLEEGKTLYRARKIDENKLHPIITEFINYVKNYYADYEIQKTLKNCNDIWDYISNLPLDEWNNTYAKKRYYSDILFWGYQEDDSDAPPKEKTISGRATPQGIRCLYTSDDIDTAISEVQPTTGQIISVAKIQTKKEMKIFDFNFYNTFSNSKIFNVHISEIEEKLDMSFSEIKIFFDIVEEQFSRPALGEFETYYATQYISEYIRNMGFEGIRFKSSVRTGGNNIVLFDTTKDKRGYSMNYEFISSSLHKVQNVKVTSSLVLPKEIP